MNPSKIIYIVFVLTGLFGPAIRPESSQDATQRKAASVSVSVTDKQGRAVTDLRQEDFVVLEDDKPARIVSFSKEERPVSYGLIVDATGSMKKRLKEAVGVAKAIVNTHGPEDKAFIVNLIDSNARLILNWTAEKKSLTAALDTINEARGQTLLLDAVNACIKFFDGTGGEGRRRALILITDGLDMDSQNDLGQIIKRLREAGIQVPAISLYKDSGGTFFFVRPPNQGLKNCCEKLLKIQARERTFQNQPTN